MGYSNCQPGAASQPSYWMIDDRRSSTVDRPGVMELETFNWLLSDPGQALLAEAMASDLSESARLRELTRLRRSTTPERAGAAYEIALLRRRAATKFAGAARMYFTREALEQASGERI